LEFAAGGKMKADGNLHKNKKSLWIRIVKSRELYFLLIPGLVWYFFFAYMPMSGIMLAFKEYKAKLGIWGSPWASPLFLNYEFLFRDHAFFQALRNTVVISFSRILFQFPIPIILALLINELTSKRYKKVLQTVFTFPNFLSWVIVAGVMANVLDSTGIVNGALAALGFEKVQILGSKTIFRPLLYITENWKSSGWSSIIYLAAITGVDQEQYESAMVDGANRWQKLFHITLPSISSTIIVMLILAVGNIMNGGFDQIFNMQNPVVKDVSEILDTYIYHITFEGPVDFSFSTAIGLFKSVFNFIFLLAADRIARWVSGSGLFSGEVV
jgi:putative aldouronate transport system permease protein